MIQVVRLVLGENCERLRISWDEGTRLMSIE